MESYTHFLAQFVFGRFYIIGLSGTSFGRGSFIKPKLYCFTMFILVWYTPTIRRQYFFIGGSIDLHFKTLSIIDNCHVIFKKGCIINLNQESIVAPLFLSMIYIIYYHTVSCFVHKILLYVPKKYGKQTSLRDDRRDIAYNKYWARFQMTTSKFKRVGGNQVQHFLISTISLFARHLGESKARDASIS